MSGSLLRAEGLAKTYRIGAGMLGELLGSRHRTLRAVDAVDLAIAPGETLALVGESGSGKTTTGRLLTLLEVSSGGRIWFDGREVTQLQGRALREYRRQVQMIFQNPYEALDPRLTVAQSVAEPLRLHGVATHGERRERVARMLEEVDLRPAASFMDRYPGDLSGGQLQRVAIARALVLSPRLIVADEPVSMLDVSVRAGIMMLLLRLQQSHGLSCLFITHDLAVARMMSQRIAVMYHGAIVEEGPTEALIARPAHPYTRMLINAVPEYGRPARRERAKAAGDDFAPAVGEIVGCAFHPRCPIARQDCASVVPQRILLGEGRAARCRYAEESAEVVSEP